MSAPFSIVLYGLDEQLLQTRQMVLKSAGYKVSCATKLTQVEQALSCETTDLVVLCHSLSLEECGRAVAMAGSHGTATLILTKDLARTPANMIREIREIITGSGAIRFEGASLSIERSESLEEQTAP
jgi:hypothetical protein